MSTGKHTEGEWYVLGEDELAGIEFIEIASGELGTSNHRTIGWIGGDPDGITDEYRDKAHLIAAAPEMKGFAASWVRFVEATFAPVNAEAGLRELDDDHELTITVEQFRELYDAARAAIAKSEGR